MLNLIGRVGCGAVVGNSSAGLKETPAFACAAVNVGSRQRGRLRASNVIDVAYDAQAVYAGVRRCVEDAQFRMRCRNGDNPYGDGSAGQSIAEVLATIPLDARLLQKRMMY
jgi:UDP-N-acetylglucosamine 2-epimerase